MDVVPLDATLVRGSHGRATADMMDGPVLISSDPALLPAGAVSAASVKALMLRHMFPATESE
jgi:hypothetical protein